MQYGVMSSPAELRQIAPWRNGFRRPNSSDTVYVGTIDTLAVYVIARPAYRRELRG